MFDKLVPNTQRRLDNITLESNRYAATPERSPVNVALTGETTARHTNSLHHIKEFRGEHCSPQGFCNSAQTFHNRFVDEVLGDLWMSNVVQWIDDRKSRAADSVRSRAADSVR